MASVGEHVKLWEPSPQIVADANVTKLITEVEDRESLKFGGFHEFRDWTAVNPQKFWSYVWTHCDVICSQSYDEVITGADRMPGAEWFKGAKLNFAKNLLRFNDSSEAIVFWNEEGPKNRLTYAELNSEVAKYRGALAALGLKAGDRAAALIPNIPEAVILMLAAASLGIVWSSCSPDFSAQGVLDRFAQIEPKIFFTVDSYLYKGKKISIADKASEVRQKLSSLLLTVKIPYLGEKSPGGAKIKSLYEFANGGAGRWADFADLPATHPLYILFSSGTTGAPKCIVHGAAGILLEHLKELKYEADIKRSDKLFYATSCGWMMWNWMVSALALGPTLVLYDGFPLARDGNILFDLAEKEGVTVFGTSAGFIQKLEELGIRPKDTHDLSKLRSILSTGSRLKPHSFDYIYSSIGNVHLSPIWGGTDLCGCLGTASPVLPVHRDEIQTRGLGLAVDVCDDAGKPVKEAPGEVVVRKPFPSMPLHFLKDADGKKYKTSYFEHFPGMWRHGDLAVLTANQGVVVLGRSDDTLNPGGVRIGAAEVTGAAERLPEVMEAMAVPHESDGEERILLFVILKPGEELTPALKEKITAEMPSPRHRPKAIIAAPDFPTTLSGKRSARAVRDAINGRTISNRDALANPQVLDWFKELPEFRQI